MEWYSFNISTFWQVCNCSFGIDDYVVIEPCAGFGIIIISSTTVHIEYYLYVQAIIHHLWIPIFLRSSTTSSIYWSSGLPFLLLSSG